MSLAPLKSVIDSHGLMTKKSLGQHFLLDAGLLQHIVRLAGDLRGVNAIEVGPGPGGLTRALLVSECASVTAIEMDRRCIPILQELTQHFAIPFRLHEADALTFDMQQIPSPRAIVANLPYNVGTELIAAWLQQLAIDPSSYRSITVMLQKEVAERIAAPVGSKAYGRMSVLAQWLCHADVVLDVPPEAFLPPPKVMSSILRLVPRAKPLAPANVQALEKVVAAAFNQRRKMLRKALGSLGVDAAALCDKAGIDETLRAEQCSVEMFCALANAFRAS
ncbi:MAG: 16S rRNA (adenine(1518)-N(6)/adenine(1519)-N(6))-dimethyltransferase RsmA [Alphaproteobacteria bacterium]|nr:16S rRNA (adenine(1518)-N(6)/adenine(1519)-N(6))-dimethyltransferase RsmA [Alphaproteobacteria bacterium]